MSDSSKTPRIVAPDAYTLNPGDNPWDVVARLGDLAVYERCTPDELYARSADAEILVINKTPLDAATFARLPKLKYVTVTATGYNVVDVDAARARGILVSNVPEYSTDTVAQFALAMILELCHRIGLHDQSVHAGDWTRGEWAYWLTPQMELAGRTLGIIGFGRIGRRVGELAHAFGMNVLATRSSRKDAPLYTPFAWADIDEIFAESDVITLHCPLTQQTAGLVNQTRLSRVRAGAMLINVSRGGLVVENDLRDALNRGTLAGAAVDVVSQEPIRADNPLLAAKNCIITPHMAWTTLDARQRMMRLTADNIAAYLAGRPINVVNA